MAPSSSPDRTQSESHDRSVPFFKLFSFADPLDYFLMLLGTLAAVLNGLSMPVVTLLFGQLINSFGQSSRDEVLHQVSQVSLRFVYLGLGASVVSFIQVAFWIVTGERQAARIRGLYLRAILRQDVTFFDKESSTGQVIERMSGDTILIQDAIGEKVGKFLQLCSTFVGGFALAFVRGWKLTLLMLAAFPLLVVAGATLSVLITKTASKGQDAYAESGTVIEQAIGAIRTVASFTGEKKAIKDYNKELQGAYKASVYQAFVTGLGIGVFMLIMFSSYALAIWYGSKLIANEGYSGGRVLTVVYAVLVGSMSLGQSSPSINAFAAGRVAAYKMFEVIHRVPNIDVYDMRGKMLDDIKGDIELNNVDFSYPARPDVQIFSKFSLHIPQGLTAALVGESGSGKSTVISLIERFYDPQGGTILLDGIDIKQLQLKWLRQQIGLVSQEPVLFGTSIKENIAYGKDGATQEEIQSAAQLANAANFIIGLPQGYATLVGEHGTQLSGGQKQRVAIARAILKNPSILLLDEATSALDAESECLVQEALDRVMTGRTTVIVAHRLTTIRNADVIAVIQNGAIVETGKHSELLQSPVGAYAQLIRLQEMHPDENSEVLNGDGDKGDRTSSLDRQRSARRSGGWTSFRRSLSRTSSLDGAGRSASIRHTKIEVQMQACNQRKGILEWFGQAVAEDPETGERNSVPDVSVFRLAALNKPEAPVFFLGSLAAAVNGVIFPIYALLMSSVIQVFFEPSHKMRKDANFWSLMFLLLAIGAFIVSPVQFFCFGLGGSRLVRRVRQLSFERVLHQEISWFDKSENSSGAISARLSTDAAQIKVLVGDSLCLAIQNLSCITSALIIAFSANWQLSLVVLAIVPLLGLQGIVQVRFMKGFSANAKVMYEEASEVATDAVGSIRTVASFCAENKVLRLYHEKCKLPLQKGVRQGILSGLIFGASFLVIFGAQGFCFWFGARLVRDNATTFKEVFRVFLALTMGAFSISQSTSLFPDIANVKAAVNSIFTLLDRKSEIDSFDESGLTPATVIGNVEFRHVSFKYPSRPDIQILNDLCLSVQAGKTVALVGESGCGKSTVVSLLQRFYDSDTGHILLDGMDIRTLQLRWLRQQMGMVSQEPVLFNISIRENVTYGVDGFITEEQIVAAAEAANAHKFIIDLPEGYSTRVGERGIQLSGGQKQRVAIARAIIKNPKILLLDEATSALDAESEHVVQEALEKVMLNRSAIVIAHRLSTIKNADLIAVVKNGVITEQGRHDELVNLKEGAYASLVRLHTTTR